MQPTESPDALLRSTTENIARRASEQNHYSASLGSILELIDNDEVELALDELARVVEYFRIPILRSEYDRLATVATLLDSMDSLTETGIHRFITA
ncbi:hypothetical protein [Streptomyces sp. SID8352]|uniref:hypothetical protein n=1 Tax=Streptomyces sp. SID8352 TaxID=2690338 RepID=UPI001370D469|nr:hypothetical protein [Streptomyces sp. SID8352]MYU21991.1 hypothetical protein [Streptomyces sp. SID8352]